jgi:hypothetical protein
MNRCFIRTTIPLGLSTVTSSFNYSLLAVVEDTVDGTEEASETLPTGKVH